MSRLQLVALLCLAAWSGTSSAVTITPTSLTYKNFARESADDRFRDIFQMTGYQIRAAKTRWTYETDLRLLPSNAVSLFETQFAYLQLATEEFNIVLFQERAENAHVREKNWRARAAALEAGRPEPLLAIAQADVELRKQKLVIAQKLVDWSNAMTTTSADLRKRAQWMLAQGAISREEYNYYLELDAIGKGAIQLSTEELGKAKKLLDEAQADLAGVTGQPASPEPATTPPGS